MSRAVRSFDHVIHKQLRFRSLFLQPSCLWILAPPFAANCPIYQIPQDFLNCSISFHVLKRFFSFKNNFTVVLQSAWLPREKQSKKTLQAYSFSISHAHNGVTALGQTESFLFHTSAYEAELCRVGHTQHLQGTTVGEWARKVSPSIKHDLKMLPHLPSFKQKNTGICQQDATTLV